jgi:hypothetical protein
MDNIQGTENTLENEPHAAFPTTQFFFQTFAK